MAFSTTDGIDVSHHNGAIDWKSVAASSVGFAYAKATEGTALQDNQFSTNYAAITANGMLRGAYHFFHPGADASVQADKFLKLVPQISPGDLPPALDIEVSDGQRAAAIVAAATVWLQKIEQALGRTPMIYTSASFWIGNLAGSRVFGRYPLWVAHYTTKPKPSLPPGFDDYTLWQYSESGQVEGIVGTVDLDRFNGNADELRHLAGY